MALHRVALAAILLVSAAVAESKAQTPPGGANCMNDFMPLRSEAEKRAAAIKAGTERKASRNELCGLFRRFSEAELKVVKYAEQNQGWCGIPPEAVATMKKNHVRTAEIEHKVCAPDPLGGAEKPKGSGLSEALGTRSFMPDASSTGRGTFDTLSGSALKQ
ncbi:MAG TPA: hypothetical protein VHN11_15955 [Xanthobacteraceae bacterium]|jgi:hypothetical protein|nr:hypothetical protein [Xanthobacteraceae bacterium]